MNNQNQEERKQLTPEIEEYVRNEVTAAVKKLGRPLNSTAMQA